MATTKKIVSTDTFSVEGVLESSTKGINVNKIGVIQKALDDYKNKVSKTISIGVTTKLVDNAIKGDNSKKMFQDASKKLDASIKELLHFVDEYKGKLDSVRQAYEQHDASVTYNFTGNNTDAQQ